MQEQLHSEREIRLTGRATHSDSWVSEDGQLQLKKLSPTRNGVNESKSKYALSIGNGDGDNVATIVIDEDQLDELQTF